MDLARLSAVRGGNSIRADDSPLPGVRSTVPGPIPTQAPRGQGGRRRAGGTPAQAPDTGPAADAMTLGQLLGLGPHRPVAGRQVDVLQRPELEEPGEERRALLGVLPVVLTGERRAHHGPRNVEPRVVREPGGVAEGARGLVHRALLERGQLLLAEPAHAAALHLVVPGGGERERAALELGVHRVAVAHRRGVDEDDVVDEIGMPVEDERPGDRRTAVDDEDATAGVPVERGGDRLGVVLEGHVLGVVAVQSGQGQRGDAVPPLAEERRHRVPRPRAEPETRDQDDLRRHRVIVARRPSAFPGRAGQPGPGA